MAVPAAPVTLLGPGGDRKATTDQQGKFEFKLLQPGSYTIRVVYPGFTKFEAANINLQSNLVFDVPLTVAMEKQAVDVQDNDQTKVSVDPSQNGSALVLRGQDLDMLSDDPDQLADDLAAQVREKLLPGRNAEAVNVHVAGVRADAVGHRTHHGFVVHVRGQEGGRVSDPFARQLGCQAGHYFSFWADVKR